MRCTSCHSENNEDRRFCAQCGASLAITCPDCEFSNEANARFCGGCGHALSNADGTLAMPNPPPHPTRPTAAPEAERRQLTVMFCDLVASTALAERLDPEDLRDLIHNYQSAVGSVVFQYEGFIAKYMGDGILIYFGYPVAHENDPERALRAGLEIATAVETIEHPALSSLNRKLAVRIGVATGLVVVGDLLGEGASEEQTVIGSTPNLAARLQDIAAPNTVVTVQGTVSLVKGCFDLRDLDTHQLKGIADPVRVFQVLSIRQSSTRFETNLGCQRLHPMVGREAELAHLASAWEKVRQGQPRNLGHAVLTRGEAGLGKSRLVRTLRDQVVAEQMPLLLFQCSPFYTNTAYFPFIAQIRIEASIEQDASQAQSLIKLKALVEDHFADPPRDLPLMAALLSLESGVPPAVAELSPERKKVLTRQTLLGQAINISSRNPLLVVVEDLQWSDPSTVELLGQLIDQLDQLPILLLISSRDEFPTDWRAHTNTSEITLKHLDAEQIKAVATHVANDKPLPTEVMQQIIDKTDGVPLYVEELTKTVIGSDLLEEKPDGYLLTGPLRALSIPATLQDSLLARLARLAPIKEIAQNAAVIGREFNFDLLAEISSLPERSLDQALRQLEQAEIISRLSIPPNSRFLFRHALVQDAAYESLLRRQRQRLHGDIAHAVLDRFPERARTEPELIAHHFTEAQQMKQAVDHWARAGHNALAACANAEAVGQLNKALTCLQHLPTGAQRDQREIEIRIALGAAYRATHGFSAQQAEQNFSRALALGEQFEHPEKTIDALRGLYAYHYINGELSTALAGGMQMLELGRRGNDSKLRMLGHWMIGGIRFWRGEFSQAQKDLEQASTLYNPVQHPGGTLADQIDPGVNTLLHMGWNLWFLGRPEEAKRMGDKSVAMARKLKQPFATSIALYWAASTRICSGHANAASVLMKDLISITDDHQIHYLRSCGRIIEGQIEVLSGKFEQGQQRIMQGLSEFASQGAGLGLPWVLIIPIDASIREGRLDQARSMLAKATAAAERNGEYQWQAELLRLSGELILADSNQENPRHHAEKLFQQARQLARQQQALALELRAATSLARLLQARQQYQSAADLITPLIDCFQPSCDYPDLDHAQALLNTLQLSLQPPPKKPSPPNKPAPTKQH